MITGGGCLLEVATCTQQVYGHEMAKEKNMDEEKQTQIAGNASIIAHIESLDDHEISNIVTEQIPYLEPRPAKILDMTGSGKNDLMSVLMQNKKSGEPNVTEEQAEIMLRYIEDNGFRLYIDMNNKLFCYDDTYFNGKGGKCSIREIAMVISKQIADCKQSDNISSSYCIEAEHTMRNLINWSNSTKPQKDMDTDLLLTIEQRKTKQLQYAIGRALKQTAIRLEEMDLTRENWNKMFPQGFVDTPIGTVKLGNSQFEKLQKEDRNKYLYVMYQTLSNPSIVLQKETFDKKSCEFRPLDVFGKSFYRVETGNKHMIESVVIFRDDQQITMGTHYKEIPRFSKQIETANQIVYIDKEVSRIASLILMNGGNHVQLKGNNALAVSKGYTQNNKKSSEISRNDDQAIYTSFLTALKDERNKPANKDIAINVVAARIMQSFPLAEQIRIGKVLTDKGVKNEATLAQILAKDVGKIGKKREREEGRGR